MSYNPIYEASKTLPVEHIAKELQEFAATGQDLSGRRFSRSPPRVPSVPSTTYEESEPPSPAAQLRDKETKELMNSTAQLQFILQIEDEIDRIHTATDKGLLEHPNPNLFDLREAAEANVKYRWIQQGIWDEQWENQPGKIWKHELEDARPPVRPSDSLKGGVTGMQRRHKRKLSDLENEYHQVVQNAVDNQDRQSSRPCYQFLYQFCQEREWIKMGLSNQDQDQDQDQGQYQQADLDARAYGVVKSRWIRDGVWDDDWTFVPGTSWRHERPRKALDPKGIYRSQDERNAARIELAERPSRWYPMAPAVPLIKLHWPSRQTVFIKAASDLSNPGSFGPSPKEKPSPRDHALTPKPHSRTSLSRSKPGTKAKPNPKSTEKRTSPKKEKNNPSVAKQKEMAKDATTSRPRRAAAFKAMKNLAKTT